MARLVTCGFELADAAKVIGNTYLSQAEFMARTTGTTALTAVTSPVRSGTYALKVVTSGSYGAGRMLFGGSGTTTTTYYARCYYQVPGYNTGTLPQTILCLTTGGTSFTALARIQFTSAGSGQIGMYNGSTLVGSTTTLSLNTWYCLEICCNVNGGSAGTGTLEFRVNGVVIATSAAQSFSNVQINGVQFGWDAGTSSTGTCYVDDVAVNDSTGANQNSYPGPCGGIVLLKPTSDTATLGSWLTGAGGATSLYAGVDNTPPVGKSIASGTSTSQIKDAANSATDNYEVNLATYSAAGVPAGATVNAVQAISSASPNATSAQSWATQIISSPAQAAEDDNTTGTVAASTYPTGWSTALGTAQYPGITNLSLAPVLLVGKRTATATVLTVCAAGVYAEYNDLMAADVSGVAFASISSVAGVAAASVETVAGSMF